VPTDRVNLQERIAAATPQDTVRGLIFNALLTLLEERLGEEAARACDPARSGSRVDFFRYPAADLLQLQWNAADRLEAQLGGVEPAFFRFGHRSVTKLLESTMGKTLLTLVGGSPRKLMGQIPGSYRTTVSYGERSVEWLGERSCRIHYRRDLFPVSFHLGLLTAGLEVTGAKKPRVEGRQTGRLDLLCEVAWEE
jgi:uncharacterized protein (TIGR02265 family)